MIYFLAALGLVLALAFVGQRATANAYRLLNAVAHRVGVEEDCAGPHRWYFMAAIAPLLGLFVFMNAYSHRNLRACVASIAVGAARASQWDVEVTEKVESGIYAWVLRANA